MDQVRLQSVLESMLFAAEHPVGVERFKLAFGEENGPPEDDIRAALESIRQRYQDPRYGFELREAQNGYHFVTKVENAEYVRTFLAAKPFRLSKSALEVMAIIAYRQPVTRAEIDHVRGIDSSHLLRVLMERDLVRMAGKAEIPGRPVQYATTPRFLEILGLNSLNDLPPLSELEQLQGHQPRQKDPLEEGLTKFMESTAEAERVDEENQAEYREIYNLLESVQNADKEVYESPIHSEVAAENRGALEAFQATTPRRSRKKPQAEVRYEDLIAGNALQAAAEPAAQEELPLVSPEAAADDIPPPEANA